MTELNGRQRRKLRSLAHHLDPVVQIGQKGLTESLIKAVGKALGTGSELVGMIGNIAIFYRENPELEKKEKINPGS
jgi:RNA-binding protein